MVKLIQIIMKLKFLLFLMLLTGIISAQDTTRTLVITEVQMDRGSNAYVELTNMGNTTIQLNDFKLGNMDPWPAGINLVHDINQPWVSKSYAFLPDKILQPGETFLMAAAWDYGPEQYKRKVLGFEGNERPQQLEIYGIADFLRHWPEQTSYGDTTVLDSVTRGFSPLTSLSGGICFFLEYHLPNGDSLIIDQVGGVFDDGGRNAPPYDVAGVEGATGNALLVRRYQVKEGNIDFANARGVGLNDSEWLPIPRPNGYDNWRDLWWTVGNHGLYILDANTLEPKQGVNIDVDFAGKKLQSLGESEDLMTLCATWLKNRALHGVIN
jgi:hypothetical protein